MGASLASRGSPPRLATDRRGHSVPRRRDGPSRRAPLAWRCECPARSLTSRLIHGGAGSGGTSLPSGYRGRSAGTPMADRGQERFADIAEGVQDGVRDEVERARMAQPNTPEFLLEG